MSLVQASLSIHCSSIARRDYESYPRDLESDYEILRALGCDMVFSGSSSRIFDAYESMSDVEMLDPGPYASGLEGEHRPGAS